jgi:hypothetical protein
MAYKPPNSSMALQGLAMQSQGQLAGLQNQANLLKSYASQAPLMQSFDASKTSQQAAEFGLDNLQRSKEFDRLLNPDVAKMRDELGSKVAEATNLEASKNWMDNWAVKKGLMNQSGLGTDSLIGRSAVYDQATEAGRQARLQNLAIQQGYLAQTPAPIGGLDPASIIAAEQAAKAQNLAAMQQYQGNVMQGTQQLNQSTTDWINQNLGQLQQINQNQQQGQQNYQQMMLQNAQQNAASSNAQQGQMIGAGGAAIGSLAGVAIII